MRSHRIRESRQPLACLIGRCPWLGVESAAQELPNGAPRVVHHHSATAAMESARLTTAEGAASRFSDVDSPSGVRRANQQLIGSIVEGRSLFPRPRLASRQRASSRRGFSPRNNRQDIVTHSIPCKLSVAVARVFNGANVTGFAVLLNLSASDITGAAGQFDRGFAESPQGQRCPSLESDASSESRLGRSGVCAVRIQRASRNSRALSSAS